MPETLHAPETAHAIAARMPLDYDPFRPQAHTPAGAAASPAHAAAVPAAGDPNQIPVDYFEIHHGPNWFLRAVGEDAHQLWLGIQKSLYVAEYYGYKYTGPRLQVVAPPDPEGGGGPSPLEPPAEPPAA